MISFKTAIQEWESPFNEKMVCYSSLTRKAYNSPENIFIIVYWDSNKNILQTMNFNVGLKKHLGRWLIDKTLFRNALRKKIEAIEKSNAFGKSSIDINYPIWFKTT